MLHLQGMMLDGQARWNMSREEFWRSKAWQSVASRRGIRPGLTIADDSLAYLHISHGRMLADCPNCNGAEYVWIESEPVIMCANCGNKDIKGMLRRVIFPENLQHIINVLLQRPHVENQNWFPYETVEDLQREMEIEV